MTGRGPSGTLPASPLIANTGRLVASRGAGVVDLVGRSALAFTGALTLVALGLWLYARAIARKGALR